MRQFFDRTDVSTYLTLTGTSPMKFFLLLERKPHSSQISLPLSQLSSTDFLLHWSKQWHIFGWATEPQMREWVLPDLCYLPPSLLYHLTSPGASCVQQAFLCIFSLLWPKLPQRLPMEPMMVEAEPMGGTGAISSPFLSHKILAENGSCNLPKTSLLAWILHPGLQELLNLKQDLLQ